MRIATVSWIDGMAAFDSHFDSKITMFYRCVWRVDWTSSKFLDVIEYLVLSGTYCDADPRMRCSAKTKNLGSMIA
ncbi:hypothetical protein OAL35_01590 [bacterium]|nr:hypothetical protein [bacterium]